MENEHIIESLTGNSKSAILACIELHNKPVFSYRYETCVVLCINAWEMILKSYILQNLTNVKVINPDGTTKPFEECLKCVASFIGKAFRPIEENIERLYEFRCSIIHFYEERINSILFSLLSKNLFFYNEFIKENFNIDLSEQSNLVLLPIGFKPISSPIDYLSITSEVKETSEAVQQFIKSIMTSTENLAKEGIEESILVGFKMSLINENRINNSDIIAAITKDATVKSIRVDNVLDSINITNDSSAKKVQVDEQTLFKTIYKNDYHSLVQTCKKIFSGFLLNKKFNDLMKLVKGNPLYHKARYLDVNQQKGVAKNYYSDEIYKFLESHYSKKQLKDFENTIE